MLTTVFSPSPYATHNHPYNNMAPPLGLPGAFSSDVSGPTEVISAQKLNENYLDQKQATDNRMETEARGYDSVFGQ